MDFLYPFIFRFTWLNSRDLIDGAAAFKLLHDRPQAVGRLRMTGAHVVVEIGRMVDEAGFTHVASLLAAHNGWRLGS